MNHIIFSVFQSNYPASINESNHRNVCKYLSASGIKHIIVNGVYNNTTEVSILLSAEHVNLVESLCRLYHQECYLSVDTNNNATLIFTSDRPVPPVSIGVWQQVCESIAKSQDSYTEHEGRYYVCSPKNLPSPSLGSRL